MPVQRERGDTLRVFARDVSALGQQPERNQHDEPNNHVRSVKSHKGVERGSEQIRL